MSKISTSSRYALSGVVLVVLLLGAVLAARTILPKPTAAVINSPRSKGAIDALIQVIEYSDFQCPACRVATQELNSKFSEWEGKVRVQYEHFPLENHVWSLLAHQAAECAARQNQFWSYHDRLYEDQLIWSVSQEPPLEFLIRYAKEEGLNLNRFGECLADSQIRQTIIESRITGSGLGVRSTPSYFINGKLFVGIKTLKEEIDRLLAQ